MDDEIDAFERAFSFGLDDSQCQDRLNELLRYKNRGPGEVLLPASKMQMKDFDLRTATFDVRELDEHDHIPIADLHLAEDSDSADSGASSDNDETASGWETASDIE